MSNSPSVTLRSRTEADVDFLFHLSEDLSTWEERGPSSPVALTESSYRARLAEADAEPPGTDVRFVIEVDGLAVGTVSLFEFDQLARHAEVGIVLIAEARGKGVGTTALAQIVEFAFVRCNLRRVHLEVIESNQGAIRSYEKVGFTLEGRQREHAWVRGRYEDILLMGLLRAEWESRSEEGGVGTPASG